MELILKLASTMESTFMHLQSCQLVNQAACELMEYFAAGYIVRRAAIDSTNGWSTFTPIAEVKNFLLNLFSELLEELH